MIKLITCDLDGTLFDNQKNISPKNIRTIKSLTDTLFVVATGRPIEGVKPVNTRLGLDKKNCYTICYNGALIVENENYNIINRLTITGKQVKEMYKESKRLNANFHAFKLDGTLVTDIKNPYTEVEEKINKIEAKIIDFNTILDDEEFLKCMIVSNKENLDKVSQLINKDLLFDLNMTRSSTIFLEFLNKEVSKGYGLKYLAKMLNIDIKETMAIGDADNDKSMIEEAGVGVCMQNSFPELSIYADYITKSNLEDGVAFAIEKFVL